MKTLQLKFETNKLNSTQLLLVKGGNELIIGETDANENHINFEDPEIEF